MLTIAGPRSGDRSARRLPFSCDSASSGRPKARMKRRRELTCASGRSAVHVLGGRSTRRRPDRSRRRLLRGERLSRSVRPARGPRRAVPRARGSFSAGPQHAPGPLRRGKHLQGAAIAVARTRGYGIADRRLHHRSRAWGLRYPRKELERRRPGDAGLVQIARQCRERGARRFARPRRPASMAWAKLRAPGRGHRPIPAHDLLRPAPRGLARSRWHCGARIGRSAEPSPRSGPAECGKAVIAPRVDHQCRSATACDTPTPGAPAFGAHRVMVVRQRLSNPGGRVATARTRPLPSARRRERVRAHEQSRARQRPPGNMRPLHENEPYS